MSKIGKNGRWAAFAGLAAATATTLVVTMAGSAMADDNSDSGSKEKATTCTEQVRVRTQPSATAPIIGSCKAGEKVTVDKTENGFAYLVNKSGWASTDYLGLDGDKSDDGNSDGNSDDNSDSDNGDDNNNDDNGGDDNNNGDDNRDGNRDGGLGL